jgi:RNA polymerase sigma-70 factor (ECF subfamily)
MPGREDRDARVSGGRDRDGGPSTGSRPVVYCLIPRDLAPKLHELLRGHFRGDPSVEVTVERRGDERRDRGDRRRADAGAPGAGERRCIRSAAGRRVVERRASLVATGAPGELPRRARAHADRLVFVERLEPSDQVTEDADTARVVTRIQAGDSDAFAVLYMRYFDRVYGYLRIALQDAHGAEDVAQQVFIRVLQALPRYERRRQPFRAWLFTIVRNAAINELRRHSRTDPVDPARLSRWRDAEQPEDDLDALSWITDRELLMLVERLPLAQRQVLVLRFMLGMTSTETAAVLGRGATDVRNLQLRALRFLRDRLAALGRHSISDRGIRMRRWPKPAPVLRSRRFSLSP